MKNIRTDISFILAILMITIFCLSSCERLEIPKFDDLENNTEAEDTPLPPNISKENEDKGNEEFKNGSKENPYTVEDVQYLGKDYDISNVWVKGYIVGWISGTSFPSGARFHAESAGATNLLLADSIFETNPTYCIPIQLPTSSTLRNDLNLQNNPQNLHRRIKVQGDITSYFKVIGLKKTKEYEWMGISAAEDEKQALAINEINESFSDYEPGMQLSQIKNWHTFTTSYTTDWIIGSTTNNRFATICHTDTFKNQTFEYWLITPPINIKQTKQGILTFDTLYENWDNQSNITIIALNDYTYDPFQILPIINAPTANPDNAAEKQWVSSGEINLNKFSGVIYIAFRYKGNSTGKQGTSFSIDNIEIY